MEITELFKKNKEYDEKAFKAAYSASVVELIREKYSAEDELAFLRQKDTKPEEFEEYNTYVEWCKSTVKSRLLDA